MYANNGVTKMPWLVDELINSKDYGFVAAVKPYETENYGSVSVMFKDDHAFMLFNEAEEAPMSRDELLTELKKVVSDGNGLMEEYYPDEYIELCGPDSMDMDIAEYYGFSEDDMVDIQQRIDDLMGFVIKTE